MRLRKPGPVAAPRQSAAGGATASADHREPHGRRRREPRRLLIDGCHRLHQPARSGPAPRASTMKENTMTVPEPSDYTAALKLLRRNSLIGGMAAQVATVPLADLAGEDGAPQPWFSTRCDSTFQAGEAANAGNSSYRPCPKDPPLPPGLVAVAVLAERAAMRQSIAEGLTAPGTSPESPVVADIIERLRAGENPERAARAAEAAARGAS
jgi:hypothetical protein